MPRYSTPKVDHDGFLNAFVVITPDRSTLACDVIAGATVDVVASVVCVNLVTILEFCNAIVIFAPFSSLLFQLAIDRKQLVTSYPAWLQTRFAGKIL